MENNLAIIQLRNVLERLPPSVFDLANETCEPLVNVLNTFEPNLDHLLYYLVLSADHGFSEELQDDAVVGYLLSDRLALPLEWVIEKCIPFWQTGSYFYDMITFCPVGISCKILDFLILKYAHLAFWKRPQSILNKLLYLLEAENLAASSLLEKYFIVVINSVKELASQTSNLGSKGQAILTILDIIIKVTGGKCLADTERGQLLYGTSSELCSDTPLETTVRFHDVNQVIDFMLLTLEEILKQISVQLWLELGDVPSLSGSNSMQEDIGHTIFSICQLIEANKLKVSQELLQCMNSLKIQPLTHLELIKSHSWPKILAQVEKKSFATELSNEEWINVLSRRKRAWKDERAISSIITNIHLAPTHRIIKKILTSIHRQQDDNMRKRLIQLFTINFASLTASTQAHLLRVVCYDKCWPLFADDRTTQITLVFNQLSKESDINLFLKEVIVLAIQSPSLVLERTLDFAVSSEENHSICLQIFRKLEPAFTAKYSKDNSTILLITPLRHLFTCAYSEIEWLNMSSFLCKLCKQSWFGFTANVCILLMNIVEESLATDNWKRAENNLSILCAIVQDGEIPIKLPVLLVFLSLVFLKCSWDVRSFRTEKAQLYGVCQKFHHSLISSHPVIEGNEWLKKFLLEMPEAVRAHWGYLFEKEQLAQSATEWHVRLLIIARSVSVPPHHCIQVDDEGFLESLPLVLIKVLPLLHSSEWLPLFKFCEKLSSAEWTTDNTFKAFSEAMTAFAFSINEDMYASFEYSFTCFTEIFNSILTGGNCVIESFVRSFLTPINVVSSQDVCNRCYTLILPSLLKCLRNYEGNVEPIIQYCVHNEWRAEVQIALSKTSRLALCPTGE